MAFWDDLVAEGRKRAGQAISGAATYYGAGLLPEFGVSEKVAGKPLPNAKPVSAADSAEPIVLPAPAETLQPVDLGGSANPDDALRGQFRTNISARGNEIDAAYAQLFADLETLLKARSGELDTQYGEQLKSAADSYAEALPGIDSSFAAIGSYDSTQRGDSRAKARKGFEDTTKTINKNKEKDLQTIGEYGLQRRAEFGADRDAARRAVASADTTTDVDALRGLSNDLDTNLSQVDVKRATLAPGAAAREEVNRLTSDNGRYESAVNALDSIIKSSMADDVKAAAVTAITDNAGLNEDEKKKIQAQYGNVYAEQAAL